MVGLVALMTLLLAGPLPATAGEVAPACVASPPRGDAAPLTLAASAAPGVMETRIHWTRWSTRLVYGQDALLAGQVVTDDGALSDVTVDLYARPAGQTDWSQVSTEASDPETGVFTFGCLDAPRSMEYQVVYAGTVLYAASSATKTVPVARKVEGDMRLRSDGRFLFSGSVAPRYVDRRVVLQRKSCRTCDWERVRASSTNHRSRWRFVVSAPSSGERRFRAVVPRDAAYAVGRSSVWVVSR